MTTINGWQVCVGNWPSQEWGEDGYYEKDNHFLLATNASGRRYSGPLVERSFDCNNDNIAALCGCTPETFDPEVLKWGQFFPVYGSDAFCSEGQELKDIHAERNNMPYFV